MIITILDTLISGMTSGNYSFELKVGAAEWQNLLSDEYAISDNNALVFLDMPIENDFQAAQSGYIGEVYDVNLFFMFKSNFDWTPLQHDSNCINQARLAIRQFISVLQDSDLIDSIEDIGTATSFINLLDVNVSGMILPISIKPNINASVCIQ